MILFRCDGCGIELHRHQLRYTVKIDVRAAYDELEVGLADLLRDHRAELEALVAKLGRSTAAHEIEESVYKLFNLDLCPACHKKFVQNPLQFDAYAAPDVEPVDIDSFLKSLGYGTDPKDPTE